MKGKILYLFLIFFAAAYLLLTSSFQSTPPKFHTLDELKILKNIGPIDSGQYFLGSTRCQGCHGHDPLGIANVDPQGNDINFYDSWESTMMALSAIDPLWRAKVSQEILTDSAHALALQTKCTECHAPMGHFTATFHGAQSYTLNDLLADTLGLNGVACGACHEIGNSDTIGLQFSGNIYYDTNRVEFGPFTDPVVGPMQLYVGLTPTYSEHMKTSQLCGSCHTLITKTVDTSNQYTGGTFVEQATFHEWLNSNFNSDQPCQNCHMPAIAGPVIIANGQLNLAPRSPYNIHKFMGGNTVMLGLMRANQASLGISVPDTDFAKTITATLGLLQNSTLGLSMAQDSLTNDTLYISITLTNKAGHKFPSGYPSRRAFVQMAVTSGNDTLFRSGMLQPDYNLVNEAPTYEPHHNIINDSSQVQVYELVMGDVNGNRTTILERAANALKDNRIPPAGFTSSFISYDTVAIVGGAATDPDFNRNGSTEGTGVDIVHYHIPMHGFSGLVNVSSAVYYQSIPPRWLTEMFTLSSTYIDSFKALFSLTDKTPVIIASGQLDSIPVTAPYNNIVANQPDNWHVFPIPTKDGEVEIQNDNQQNIDQISIWDAAGRKVSDLLFGQKKSSVSITLPDAAGLYFVKIYSGNRTKIVKLMRQ